VPAAGVVAGLSATALLALAPPPARPAADASRDGQAREELTPIGAERAGNTDGTIPSWDGGLTRPPEGWTAAHGYIDPFPGDKPSLTITGANAEQHASRLTAGEAALLAKYPEFRINVYPTRRTAALPAAVTERVRAQAGKAWIEGFGLKDAGGSTTPFPVPRNGLEAIWNHLVRYLGGGVIRTGHSFPVRANGDHYKIGFRSTRIYASNIEQPEDNRLFYALGTFTEPATLRGTAFLVHEPLDQVAESRSAWIYNAGSRRVRRAPDLAYDGINDGSEGMVVTDQIDGYNGAPDRYDWKLVGKQEVYIPYNSYKLSDKKLKYKENIIRKNTVNPDVMRYELHRCWVIEANLKAGSKHIYGKRVFYLDEDSWTVVYEDAYDTRKQLWRVSMHPMIQFYDAKVPWYRANVWHDLSNGSYLLSLLENEIRTPWKFGDKGKWADFQPDALRRAGTK
jgi:Protein of unknown function (DUF1329)